MTDILEIYAKYIHKHLYKSMGKFWKKSNKFLDLLSRKICFKKPTLNLVSQRMKLPNVNASILSNIFNVANIANDNIALALAGTLASVLTVPFQMLNDKKFVTLLSGTSTAFAMANNPQPQTIVTDCEKMLMYIAKNRNKIKEPAHEQILTTTTIHNKDYDLPVEEWYTFKISPTEKIYFFVHISPTQDNKSILLASKKKTEKMSSLIGKMKTSAKTFYNQTLAKKTNTIGVPNAPQLNFI